MVVVPLFLPYTPLVVPLTPQRTLRWVGVCVDVCVVCWGKGAKRGGAMSMLTHG